MFAAALLLGIRRRLDAARTFACIPTGCGQGIACMWQAAILPLSYPPDLSGRVGSYFKYYSLLFVWAYVTIYDSIVVIATALIPLAQWPSGSYTDLL